MRRKRRNPSGYQDTIRTLPVLGLRERVILPLGVPSKPPLWAARKQSIGAVRQALAENGNGEVLLLAQENTVEEPTEDDFFPVGAVATVLESLETKNGEIKIIVEGYARAVVLSLEFQDDILTARVRTIQPSASSGKEEGVEELMRRVITAFENYFNKTNRRISNEDQSALVNETNPGQLGDLVAYWCGQKDPNDLNLSYRQLQQVLNVIDPIQRLELVLDMVNDLLDVIEIEENLQAQVKKQVEKTQREYYLSEKLKAIQKELGRGVDGTDTAELRERVKAMGMTEEAEEKAIKEIDRLDQMPPMSAEASVVRSYIDWLLALPWSTTTEAVIDLDAAWRMLDEDHYGLKDVKERIIEYLAVVKLVEKIHGPIICFVGPPGVGKTSLGRSIARAMGRNFVRMSLGGVRDEAEIRGHRRTYIGSIPGRIIQGVCDAKSRNPLFLLDEVDKMSMDFRGDPSAALLEVLDPEQNATFRDHYLDIAFDLSDVMFLTTANVLPAIPPALRDRMEILELPGYTEYEKTKIGRQFLIPKQTKAHGFEKGALRFTDKALQRMIRSYTREAGVRNLEREVTKICRKVARQVVSATERGDNSASESQPPMTKPHSISARNLGKYLGPPRYLESRVEAMDAVGVAQGLVYTQVGGDVISIEVTIMPAAGREVRLTLTGQLGEVMRESAQAALSYIRSNAGEFGLSEFKFQEWDIHIHVPEGAVPKEGPSAGITLATAMVSALTGRPVRKDLAMTGEITLRGNVLPIGGIKEKLLAAHRLGIRDVLVPKQNVTDIEEVPAEVRRDMKIQPVEHMTEVLRYALRERSKGADEEPENVLPASQMPVHRPDEVPPPSQLL